MCGITGIIDFADRPVQLASLRAMNNAIVHRGPDDEGYYLGGRVGLAMRRLSIIDVAGGSQPIHNEDKTIWIVFNGEIYNFLELRATLEARGHKFSTSSDTEAIVHAYEEYGTEVMEKLHGMFSFAIHDITRGSVLLARDRLGKKPLHYARHQNRLYFGSEIKSLLAVAPELAEPDVQALFSYFQFGYIPDPQSAFRNIQKLAPGCALEIRNGETRTWPYWHLPAYNTWHPASEEECLEELEPLLVSAVQKRMISEVPLGGLLSGGVDSSLVVALMAHAKGRVKTFSISVAESSYDESRYARTVAERFGTEHQEFTVEPNISETVEFLTHHMEEPFGDSSAVPTFHVCRIARQHVTVALAGDGGDEFFGGYDRYGIAFARRILNRAPRLVGPGLRSAFSVMPHRVPGRRFLFNASLNAADRYIDSVSYLPPDREREVFSPDFLAQSGGFDPGVAARGVYDSSIASDALSRMMYFDARMYLPYDILTKVDRMSMANSLEVRAPLLDHILVEKAVALGSEWKWRAGEAKYILKKLAERLGVPRNVLYRPKRGFAIPLVHWMRRELRRELLDILVEPQAIARGYFRKSGVQRLIDEHIRGDRDHTGRLWILAMFELWHRNYLHRYAIAVSSSVETPDDHQPANVYRLQAEGVL